MLKVKIEKKLHYLSPSSLNSSLKEPNKFYLTRLVYDSIPKEPQGKGAAIGTAFDILVKRKIWSEGISKETRFRSEKDENNIEIKDFKSEALQIGKRILNSYIRGAYSATIFKQLEVWRQFTFHNIPIYVKLDATCLDKKSNLIIPFDWKVSGFNPDSNPMSPKPYYQYQYVGREIGIAHKKYCTDIEIQEIDLSWAIQTCTYGWSIGLSTNLDKPFPVRIDMLTTTKKNIIKCSSYRAIVTPIFQKYVFELYKDTWTSIIDGTFINKLNSQYDRNLIFIASTNEKWY